MKSWRFISCCLIFTVNNFHIPCQFCINLYKSVTVTLFTLKCMLSGIRNAMFIFKCESFCTCLSKLFLFYYWLRYYCPRTNVCLFTFILFVFLFIYLFIYLSNGSFHLLFSFYSCLSPAPSGNTYLVGDLAEATTWLAEQSIWIWAGLEDSAIRAVWETRLVYRRGLNASLARSVMIEAFVGVEVSTTLDTSMTTWIIVIAQRITGSVIVCSLSAGNRDKKACVSQTFKEWIG